MRKKKLFIRVISYVIVWFFIVQQVFFSFTPLRLFAEETKKKQTIDEILKEFEGKKKGKVFPERDEKVILLQESLSKYKLAVVYVENISSNQDETLTKRALHSITEALVQTGRFQVVDREMVEQNLKEIKLSLSGFMDPSTTQEVGKLIGADALVVGMIKSVDVSGDVKKPCGVLAEVSVRVIKTETAQVLTALSAKGNSGNVKGQIEIMLSEAINRAVRLLTWKIPAEVKAFDGKVAEINLGSKNGLKAGDEMLVQHGNIEIGRVKLTNVLLGTSSGTFTPTKKEFVPQAGDQVLYTALKDDNVIGCKKPFPWIYILLGVGLLAALLAGGGGGGGNGGGSTTPPPNVPPVLPNP